MTKLYFYQDHMSYFRLEPPVCHFYKPPPYSVQHPPTTDSQKHDIDL